MNPSLSSTPLVRLSPRPCRRRPCDRCHTVREKCRWPTDNHGADTCERCLRLKRDCRTDRPVGRVGRKARLATGNRLSLRKGHWQPASSTSGLYDAALSDDDSATVSSPRSISSPLDQIVILPERRTTIPVLHNISLFPGLSDVEFHLIESILYKQTDVDKYLIGSSFRDQHQQAFANHLKAAMPLVRDAFIACAPLLLGHQDDQQLAEYQDIGHKRAAAAIASLRNLKVHHDHDLSTVLILGVALVTFATHYSGGELLLCRHILGLVKDRCADSGFLSQRLDSDTLSFLICILGTETIDCLMRCEIPTIQIRPGDLDEVVDRFIGICAPLLVHFYDICKVAKLIRHGCYRRGNVLMSASLGKTLTEIEDAVTSWQPNVPADFLAGRFTPTEVVLMLAQVKVLRFAALLVLHRLRYAFGTQDGKGLAMAHAVLHELNIVIRFTGKSVPFGDLAYMVSCLEITDPSERQAVLEESLRIVDISPRFRHQVETWIVSFWAVRDDENSPPHYWDNLVAYLQD